MVDNGRMDCGHVFDALVWDDYSKKNVCGACRNEALAESSLKRVVDTQKDTVRNVLCRYKIREKDTDGGVWRLVAHVVDLEAELAAMKRTKNFVVPLPLTEQSSANGTKVDHEGKVIAEVSAVTPRKAVVRFVRGEVDVQYQKHVFEALGVPPSFCEVQEEQEVQYEVIEVKPGRNTPGVVGIRVTETRVPVRFSVVTDKGNHRHVLEHAKYILQAIFLACDFAPAVAQKTEKK